MRPHLARQRNRYVPGLQVVLGSSFGFFVLEKEAEIADLRTSKKEVKKQSGAQVLTFAPPELWHRRQAMLAITIAQAAMLAFT
jgi:hypothetical protein